MAAPLLSTLTEHELNAAIDRAGIPVPPPLADRVADWMTRTRDLISEPELSFAEPEDRGLAILSELGDIEYVEDLLRPGRIVVVAAEEGTGKSYAVGGELAIRLAVAGGAFAETWPVLRTGPVLLLSEMHGDDDYQREERVLAALGRSRSDLAGRSYRLSLMTAADGEPVLKLPAWREWAAGWLKERGFLAMLVDTATAATNVDPWGTEIQAVYRGLRLMQSTYPDLAIVLVVHLRKPQGRGTERRLSDVLGEWGRWCDVIFLMENDGASLERVKLTVRKRVRRERRLVATKRDGLLVEPADVETAGPKVPLADVIAAVEAEPGLSQGQLAARLGVAESTVRGYLKAAIQAGQVDVRRAEKGGKAVFPVDAHGAGVRAGAVSVSHPSRTLPKGDSGGEGVRGAGGIYTAPPSPAPLSEESEEDLLEQATAWRFGIEPEPDPQEGA